MKNTPPRDRLIVALDTADADSAWRLVETLGERVTFYKVGLALFVVDGGVALVQRLADAGKQVFADLKCFDIPRTVAAAVRHIDRLKVRFVTVHGNDAMLRAAVEVGADCGILAVTALTSLDRADLRDLGFQCRPEELVLSRARRAVELGCAGVVASGREVSPLRAQFGDRPTIVVPGIRPIDNLPDDHKRAVDVSQALQGGADYVVVGRPITQATDPAAAADALQARIAAACAERAQGRAQGAA